MIERKVKPKSRLGSDVTKNVLKNTVASHFMQMCTVERHTTPEWSRIYNSVA